MDIPTTTGAFGSPQHSGDLDGAIFSPPKKDARTDDFEVTHRGRSAPASASAAAQLAAPFLFGAMQGAATLEDMQRIQS